MVWIRSASVCGLFFAALVGRSDWLRSSNAWLAAALVTLVWNAIIWRALDNHIFFVGYWVLAVGLALRSSDVENALRTNARVLIGLAFLFAVFWKAISPDYLSGDFFEFELLSDSRFSFIAELAGGLAPDVGASNVAGWVGQQRSAEAVVLASGPRIGATAQFLTWWTIGIESLLVILFLGPERFVPAWLRYGVLVVFCVSTYSLVPVTGFAAAILAMTCAIPTTDRGRLVAAGSFLLLITYSAAFHSARGM
ncbi:MAG: hypothetical protein AB8H86_31245 [Polyangiales bacterium]